MTLIDVGQGLPVVLVPGIQGRWEWMQPTVDALARRCRVITFSLADEPSADARFDAARGFDCYVDQIAEALTAAGLQTAAVCGVSYGGLIAAAFAARHPDRVNALVLVSAIPPSWRPDARVNFYLRAPWLLSPLFCVGALRMYPEIAAAVPGVGASLRTAVRHGLRVVTHMFSPGRMARRARLLESVDLEGSLRAVTAPALIITGDARLDRVVPVARTREYLRLWPHATEATLANTGHIGLITRPEAFVDLVVPFVAASSGVSRRRAVDDNALERRIG